LAELKTQKNDASVEAFLHRVDEKRRDDMDGFEHYDELLGKLGKHSTGKSCLYVKRLADVEMDVLRQLVQTSVEHMRVKNG